MPRVLILGLPYFGKLLSDLLGERGWQASYRAHPRRNLRQWAALAPDVARADLIYLISSRVDRRSPQALLATVRRGPLVIHWVGTDVVFAQEAYAAGDVSRRLISQATHMADAPWLVGELADLGIVADHVALPMPALQREEPAPLPERFSALLYYPVDPIDREVFDWETMLRLTREFPDVRFQLVPSPPETLPQPLPPNLEAQGWVSDTERLYREVSVYIRLTAHDGMSFMAAEALSRGRYVIWTWPLDGATLARGFDEVSAALRGLWERHQRGQLGLNVEGRASVLAEFDFERLASQLDARLRAALRR